MVTFLPSWALQQLSSNANLISTSKTSHNFAIIHWFAEEMIKSNMDFVSRMKLNQVSAGISSSLLHSTFGLICPHFLPVIKAGTLRRTHSSSHGLTDGAAVTSAGRFAAKIRTFWLNCRDHTASVFNLGTHKRPCDQLGLQASCLTKQLC